MMAMAAWPMCHSVNKRRTVIRTEKSYRGKVHLCVIAIRVLSFGSMSDRASESSLHPAPALASKKG